MQTLLACAAFSACGPARAQSWDWTYNAATPAPLDAMPIALSKPDSSGFWAIGDGLVHYHPDATVDFARPGRAYTSSLSAGTADGGIVFTTAPFMPPTFEGQYYACSLVSYSADGNPRWQQTLPDYQSYCQRLGVDGRQVIWASAAYDTPQHSFYSLTRISADGVMLAPVTPDQLNLQGIADFAVNPHAGGVFVASSDSPASIVGLGPYGAIAWAWHDPDSTHILQQIIVGADGNIYSAGLAGTTAGTLVIASTGSDGTPRFVNTIADVQLSDIVAMAPAAGGGVYLLDDLRDASGDVTPGNVTQLAVQRIGSDGTLLWTHTLSGLSCEYYLPDCGLNISAEGDVVFDALTPADFGSHLLRYDSSGHALFSKTLPPGDVEALVLLANGDALLTLTNDEGQTANFLQLDRAGNPRPAPATANLVDLGFQLASSTLLADGSSYLLAYDYRSPEQPAFIKVAPSGQEVWRNTTDIAGSISIAGDLACSEINGALAAITCVSAATGEKLWVAPLGPLHVESFRVLDDGQLVAVASENNGTAMALVLLDHGGNVVSRKELPMLGSGYAVSAISGDGVVVRYSADGTQVYGFDRTGTQLYGVSVPDQMRQTGNFSDSYPVINVLTDGSALITLVTTATTASASTATSSAWLLSPHGSTRWLLPLIPPQQIGDAYNYSISALPSPEGVVYFVLRSLTDSIASTSAVTLQARSLANGYLYWQDTAVATDTTYFGGGSTLVQDAATRRLLLISRNADKVGIKTIDPASGSVLLSRYEPCSAPAAPVGPLDFGFDFGSGCDWNNAVLGNDGTLRVNTLVYAPADPNRAQVMALRNAADVPAPVHIDQPGIDGAWYASYETGQGFTIDFIASANTVFAPWFTYTQSGDNAPYGLAWYALQGTVAAGATSADLEIDVTDPGSFNAGIVPTHAVGTAHLSFSDCNSGTLIYQFNPTTNGGAGGLISLTRLTPSTDACMLGGGATPAQIANPPAQGFDAHQSGSWYDPDTSGQGLEMTIIPAGNDYPGLLFAAWFTFDAYADDALHQHWFTVQGDLSAAADGAVTLPILRTTGGSFDSLATDNTVQVGHATLTMQGCDHARLDYQFDTSEIAHAFRGQSGSTSLVKIGGCTASGAAGVAR